MIRSFTAAMFVSLLGGCSSGESANQKPILESHNEQSHDSTLQKHQTREELVLLHKPSNVQEDLLGVWASDNKEPLTIQISSDSIFYTEHFQSYKYRLQDDSIYIQYPDYTFSAMVFFNKDTLLMQSKDGLTEYFRFKE